MTNNLIVPLDGSDLSELALPVADQIAAGLSATITLVSAGWGSTVAELDGYLRTNASMLATPSATRVVSDTFPATAITDLLDTPADTVVMGTHGRSGVGRALLGSVAEEVIGRTGSPVVLVGRSATVETPIAGGHLLLASDGSPRSAHILPTVARWARGLDLTVTIVTVAALDDPTEVEQRRAADASMAFLTEEGVSVDHRHVVATDAARAIVDLAAEVPAALIAMTTPGRSGLGRTVLGSITMKVVNDARCPVLIERSTV